MCVGEGVDGGGEECYRDVSQIQREISKSHKGFS